MRRVLLVLVVVLLQPLNAVNAQLMLLHFHGCGPREALVVELANTGHDPRGIGFNDENNVEELWIREGKDPHFVWLSSHPDVNACVLSKGTNWDVQEHKHHTLLKKNGG